MSMPFDAGLRTMKHVWIVEMKVGAFRWSWVPTAGCALTKEDCKTIKMEWQNQNPDDRFRVVKYSSSSPKAMG